MFVEALLFLIGVSFVITAISSIESVSVSITWKQEFLQSDSFWKRLIRPRTRTKSGIIIDLYHN